MSEFSASASFDFMNSDQSSILFGTALFGSTIAALLTAALVLVSGCNAFDPRSGALACTEQIVTRLQPALTEFKAALEEKQQAFDHVLKISRTHLQDATPVRLGQVFGGYATQVGNGWLHLERTLPRLTDLALGEDEGLNKNSLRHPFSCGP